MNKSIEKRCCDCKQIRPLSDFYSKSSRCKECAKKRSKEYYEENKNNNDFKAKRKNQKHQYDMRKKLTKDGWYSRVYNNMRQRNKRKFSKELPFTKNEFILWIDTNYHDVFDDMFSKYIKSNCDKKLVPSIDRIDDYDSYHFENMQLVTWEQNDIKGTNGIKNKVSCAEVGKKYCSKTVIQYDENMNIIMKYSSTHEVNRILGFDSSLIAKACREGFKSKGYYWAYEIKN